MTLKLTQSCRTCQHYDGDHYCALPETTRIVMGYIRQPSSVVCVQHEKGEA